MAVRRLHPEQPESFAFTPENQAWAEKQIEHYPEGRQASAVIAILWRAQEQHDGWLPEPAIRLVAEMLGMPYIRVLEIATFYTMFQLQPVGSKAHFQVCGTTPCMLRGSEDLISVCKKRIAATPHALSADGAFSWEEVECLGMCVNAPVVQMHVKSYEDLTPERFEEIIDAYDRGEEPPTGPQIDRRFSAPAGGATTLTSLDFAKSDAKPGPAANADAPAPKTEPEEGEVKEPDMTADAAGLPDDGTSSPADHAVEDAEAEKQAPSTAAKGAKPADGKSADAKTADDKSADAKPADDDTAAALPDPDDEEAVAAKLAELGSDASPEQKADAVGSRPATIDAPRGEADDLKRIKGIGKVNERKLNELGVWHFDQIAGWNRAEVRWIGTYLAFAGRIDREDWLGQAKILAEGGETEFAKRVDAGEVASSAGGAKQKPDDA